MVICQGDISSLLKDYLLPVTPILGRLRSNTWGENIKFKASPPRVRDETLSQRVGSGIKLLNGWTLAVKPDDLSSIPRTHMLEGENRRLIIVFCSFHIDT